MAGRQVLAGVRVIGREGESAVEVRHSQLTAVS
jgi:hypothetical protein